MQSRQKELPGSTSRPCPAASSAPHLRCIILLCFLFRSHRLLVLIALVGVFSALPQTCPLAPSPALSLSLLFITLLFFVFIIFIFLSHLLTFSGRSLSSFSVSFSTVFPDSTLHFFLLIRFPQSLLFIPLDNPSDPRTLPCRFFQLGQCTKGAQCPFTHQETAAHFTPTHCKFFLNGFCRNGDR